MRHRVRHHVLNRYKIEQMLNFCAEKVNDYWRHLAPTVQTVFQMMLAQSCALCHRQSDEMICSACMSVLDQQRINPLNACPQCAMPKVGGFKCGQCLKTTPAFDRTIVCYQYHGQLKKLISQYKFQGKLWLSRWMANELRQAVEASGEDLPDLILPIPLHPNRLKQRGYNQSWEIVRQLKLGTVIMPDGLVKTKDIVPQRSLSKRERQKNPIGAFVCSVDVSGKRVAVVDDVMTTGATLSEVARVLKSAGATSVVNWVIARTH